MIFQKEDRPITENKGNRLCLTIVFILYVLSVIILFPMDMSTIEISHDSRSTLFTGIVYTVIITKYVCLITWLLMIYFDVLPAVVNRLVTIVGTVIILLAAFLTGLEIYLTMKDQNWYVITVAIVFHPFSISFFFFLLCAIPVFWTLWNSDSASEDYTKIPQMAYPMDQFYEMNSMPQTSAFTPPMPSPAMETALENYFTAKGEPSTFIPYYVGS
eukprot:TRINITY_DN8513_c0_g2_i4.p1 TRINITY_DN8513_c0_g2~~TRINITY_DN8513_c0_g2_i4.p1  ORF type:complete len:215 (+),score=5.84 TRINITY_DN8513_c0_g2_i4:152-796(+)